MNPQNRHCTFTLVGHVVCTLVEGKVWAYIVICLWKNVLLSYFNTKFSIMNCAYFCCMDNIGAKISLFLLYGQHLSQNKSLLYSVHYQYIQLIIKWAEYISRHLLISWKPYLYEKDSPRVKISYCFPLGWLLDYFLYYLLSISFTPISSPSALGAINFVLTVN